MHEIQEDILRRIILVPEARYSDLKSDYVDGNLFMYHLNQLMGQGIIEKNEKTYSLSLAGKQLIGTISSTTGSKRQQSQILTLAIIKNREGKYLLFRWRREPNTGQVSFPHGMLHFGEFPRQAMQRELLEKASLQVDLKYKGDVYISMLHGEELFNHQLVHVFAAEGVEGQPTSSTENGEPLWGSPEDFTEVEVVPGTWEIMDVFEKGELEEKSLVAVEVAL